MCECITKINEFIKDRNGRLALTFSMNGDVYPTIEVEKIEPKKRQKPPLAIPTFCPFCGEKYQREEDGDD